MPLMRGGGIESMKVNSAASGGAVHTSDSGGSGCGSGGSSGSGSKSGKAEKGTTDDIKSSALSSSFLSGEKPPERVFSFSGSRRPRGTGRGKKYLFGSRVNSSNSGNDINGDSNSSTKGDDSSNLSSHSTGDPSFFAKRPGRPRGSRGSRGTRGSRGSRGSPVAVGTRRIGGVPVPVESGSFKGRDLLRLSICSGLKRPRPKATKLTNPPPLLPKQQGRSPEAQLHEKEKQPQKQLSTEKVLSMPIVSEEDQQKSETSSKKGTYNSEMCAEKADKADTRRYKVNKEGKRANKRQEGAGIKNSSLCRSQKTTLLSATSVSSSSSLSSSFSASSSSSTTFLSHPRPRLAYSSATNKPVCLCIIWVHLQASVTCEGLVVASVAAGRRHHQCIIKKAPEPVSRGNHIVCNYCRCGYASYPLYLDHLHSSQCGHRQRRNNKPQTPMPVVLPPLELTGHLESLRDIQQMPSSTALSRGKDTQDTKAVPTSASSFSTTSSVNVSSSIFSSSSPAIVSLEKAARQICSQVGESSFGGSSSSPSIFRSKRRKYNHSTSVGGVRGIGGENDLNKMGRQPLLSYSQQMQQQQLQHAGITKPYFQHHIHSQQQQYHSPFYQQHLFQPQQQQHRPRHHHHMHTWQHHNAHHQSPRLYHPYHHGQFLHPYGYLHSHHMHYGNTQAYMVPHQNIAGWSQWPPHWQMPPPPPPPPPPYQHHHSQSQMHSPDQNFFFNQSGWEGQHGYAQTSRWHEVNDASSHFTSSGWNSWNNERVQQQQHHMMQQQRSSSYDGSQHHSQAYFQKKPHSHQHQHRQHHQQHLQQQEESGLDASFDDASLLAAINASQQQYQQGGNRGHHEPLQLQYVGPAGVGEEEQQEQQHEQQQRQQEQHSFQNALSQDEDSIRPPRPSSDDDVIRAAAEVVARDNGTLPVLHADGANEQEDGEEESELFTEDASGTEVVVTNELTSDEVASLAGFANIGNLNSLVSFVSETCLSSGSDTNNNGPDSNVAEIVEAEEGNSSRGEEQRQGVDREQQHHGKQENLLQDQGSRDADNCFLKEGSEDPVLTATAQMVIPVATATTTTTVISTEGAGTRICQVSTAAHQQSVGIVVPPSAGLEVVITEKSMEFGGSEEETLTLHYPTPILEGTAASMATTAVTMATSDVVGESGVMLDMNSRPGDTAGNITQDASASSASSCSASVSTYSQCPHQAVDELPRMTVAEQARDKHKLDTMQGQLGYLLVGLLGEKRLAKYGYPDKNAISILNTVLELTKNKVVEENFNCSTSCCDSGDMSNSNGDGDDDDRKLQLESRKVQRRIAVLRANIGKLLCICVPVRHKWREFGWDGKGVDEILEELSKVELPKFQPGDQGYEERHRELEGGDEDGKQKGIRIQRKQGSSVKINMQDSTTTSLDDEGEEQSSSTGRDKREEEEEEREAVLMFNSNFVTSSKVAREEETKEVTPSVGREGEEGEKEEMPNLEEEVDLVSELGPTVAVVATGEQDMLVEVSAESMEVEGEVTLGGEDDEEGNSGEEVVVGLEVVEDNSSTDAGADSARVEDQE